jgi:hypothetical protein
MASRSQQSSAKATLKDIGRQAAASLTRRSDLLNCLLLAAIPIAMSIANSEWLYNPIGWIDPWVNVGYFLQYSDPQFGAGYYKAARLSWIIPGFIAYHVFQPIVANYVLHMGCLILSVLFLYLTIARLLGKAVAFAIAACFAVFYPIHGSGGWDYQNAAAGAFYMIAFYMLTRAVLSKQPGWPAIGAGAAYAAAVYATIGFVNLAPILVFHCFALYRHQFARFPSWRYVLRIGVWVLFGALALTVLLGLVNVAVGREFIFFRELLELVVSFLQNSQKQAAWWLPWSKGWFLNVSYLGHLALGVAVLVGCIVCTILGILGWRFNAIAVSFQAQYIFIALLWVVWQSLGQTAFEPEYFAYPIYPVLFFGLAGIAATWRRPVGPSRAGVAFYIFVALIVAIPLCFPFMGSTLSYLTDLHVKLIRVASALVVVGLFAICGSRPTLLAVAVLAFAARNGFEVAAIGDEKLYSVSAVCADRSNAYMALVDSNLFVSRFVPNSTKMYVWWNEQEVFKSEQCGMRIGHFAASLTALGLFDYLAPPWEGMPVPDALPEASIAAMTGDSTAKIVIPTADYANVEAIIARYHRAGVELAAEERTIIRTPRFSLYVLGRALAP